ncbi:hypothetical protein WJX74_003456 [Apatococcus lobatus]|uniref:Uncharacterized protein n=1 Tax=Apatococcus lobatus TaxID=904363 RepID=A0AAW1R2S3_9CHLO
MYSQRAAEQMATLMLTSSSYRAMQEPGVQCWLQSAVPKLRLATNCQKSQLKQGTLQQQQACFESRADCAGWGVGVCYADLHCAPTRCGKQVREEGQSTDRPAAIAAGLAAT